MCQRLDVDLGSSAFGRSTVAGTSVSGFHGGLRRGILEVGFAYCQGSFVLRGVSVLKLHRVRERVRWRGEFGLL